MYYKKKIFVSILITNYNKEKFLKKSIKSCLNQNFREKEIIIFDDCSNDKSLKIIKKFSKVKVIKNKRKKYLSGPLNQIYGLSQIFKKSKALTKFLYQGLTSIQNYEKYFKIITPAEEERRGAQLSLYFINDAKKRLQ